MNLRKGVVPAGSIDFIGLSSLVDVPKISPSICVTYDGRPAVVCVPPLENDRFHGVGHVLIRYLDGNREIILANPYECAVGAED